MVNPVVTWLSEISLALLNPIYIFNLATWFFHSNLQKLKPFFWLYMLQQGVGKQHWIRGHGLLLKHHWDSCPLLRFQNTRGVRDHSLKFCRIFWHKIATHWNPIFSCGEQSGCTWMYSGEGWEYQVRWWTGENWDCEMVKCWAGSTRWDGEMPLSVLRNWWWTKLKYNYKSQHWYRQNVFSHFEQLHNQLSGYLAK